MKKSIFHQIAVAVFGFGLLFGNAVMAMPVQETVAEQEQDSGLEFNFNKADWETVIEWYAAQAGLFLEKVDQYPEGSFSLISDRPMSPVEAIDEINHRLRLSDPPKTLLRNGVRLYLVDAERELPAALVETIDVRELKDRGKYEVLQVVFDVSGLVLEDIESQIQQRVSDYNEPFFQTYPDTKEIFVRETGENLRFIRDIITRAKQNLMGYSDYRLKYISAEMFLEQLRPFLNLDESYRNESGTLILSVDSAPGSQRIMMRGTPDLVAEVKKAAAVIDVKPEDSEGPASEKMYLQEYLVPRDTKEAFEIIDRLLFDEGGGARVAQGSETGKIFVMGRTKDHEIVNEFLNLQSSSGGFATIQLKNGTAGEILVAVQNLMNITAENAADGPTMIANTVRDFIMVRGTPQQVAEAKQYIEELDKNAAPVSDGLRTRRRVVPTSTGDRDRILERLEDFWPTMGRDNPFEVGPFNIRRSKAGEDDESLLRKREKDEELKRQMRNGGAFYRPAGSFRSSVNKVQHSMVAVAFGLFPSSALRLSTALLQSPDEPSPGDKQRDGYELPKQIESVEGAPVRVWGTPFGIIVESDDLDAADDVEYLIDQLLGEESNEAKPTIYQLKHVEASNMKSLIETIYGLESSDGGGDGGGLLSGIAGNVMGEAAGGMADALFGGGLGGGSALSTLEGDVSISVDGRLNYMIVIGATESDLDQIDATVETFDISTSPQNPELGGQIYSIQIQHRDPEEIKMHVETLLEIHFKDADANKSGGGGNDAANMMKMMQALGKGGGGSKSAKEVKARGYLDVDIKTGKLLFMGPKSIFIQVEALVAAIDLPEVAEPRIIKTISLGNLEPEDTIRKLKEILGGDKIDDTESVDGEGEAADGSKVASNKAGGDSSAAAAQQKAQEAARNNFIQMMRARGGGATGGRTQGGRGQGGGRGGQGGGGGRGGGGRGGR